MPELPEVEEARRRLQAAAVGRRIAAVRVLHPSSARALPVRDQRALVGAVIAGVDRRGKHQVIRLRDGRALHAHFRMNGDWEIEDAGDPLPPHARYVIELADGSRVALVDSRALATLRLLDADEDPYEGLGPEATDPMLDGDWLRGALAGRRVAVKVALLDQRVVAGLGNIYAAEALWEARIDPRVIAGSLTRAQCDRLATGMRRALEEATRSPGRYSRGESIGRLHVYGREGEPCDRCGRAIARIIQGGRSTFYCPGCQKRR